VSEAEDVGCIIACADLWALEVTLENCLMTMLMMKAWDWVFSGIMVVVGAYHRTALDC
jgi:hypothetical protein